MLIVGLGAFGWMTFWKAFAESWDFGVSDKMLRVLLLTGAAATVILLAADVTYCRWVAIGTAGFGVAVLTLELFLLLSVATDVQRVRVLLASREGRTVPRP